MIILPKIYNNEGGKYPQYKGKYKLSYSQYTSWRDIKYRDSYILQYFFGVQVKSPFEIFATYGTHCGEYIETKGGKVGDLLSTADKTILDSLEYPKNSTYEDEIVFPVKDTKGEILFVIQGFIDRAEYLGDNKVGILDYKTGNADKKVEEYGSLSYGQTTLYALCKETEGYSVEYSKVVLLGRKGNGRVGHPLRLDGQVIDINTPYSKERADNVIKDMTKVAREISDYYKVLLKLRK